jgi:hypothetical protein
MFYKDIIIKYDDEEFRKQRLIKVINEMCNDFGREPKELIRKLEDDKGTLNIYWLCKVSIFLKNVVNSIWMDNHELHTNHIILEQCACCNAPPQKEDETIKNYINNLNYII